MYTIPSAIASAAVALLQPYCPELSPASLVEALKNRNATPKASKMKPLTRREAAEILKVSIASINRYIKSGTLRAYKIGKRLVRIDPASVEALMQTAPAAAPGE